jgi:hypothetical protein
MSDDTEFDIDWAKIDAFTWRDYAKAGVGLVALAALIWWMVR